MNREWDKTSSAPFLKEAETKNDEILQHKYDANSSLLEEDDESIQKEDKEKGIDSTLHDKESSKQEEAPSKEEETEEIVVKQEKETTEVTLPEPKDGSNTALRKRK